MSLTSKIFLGMGLGILLGVFFGEEVAFLSTFGDAFILLLQMSILPFVALSLITGVGRLTYKEAFSLAKNAGAVLLTLWAIALGMVATIPLAFPDWESASFFSPSLVEGATSFDFLQLYIPSNPFYSLANSMVPAIVLFSIIVGVALIGIDEKATLLDSLSVLLDAMGRVTGFVVRLAPWGVLAIAASAAGTMRLEELGRVQVYLLIFIATALVLTFWILPALVSNLTPLSYSQVVLPVRSALLTAFATGNHMIVLPILSERGRELLREAELGGEESDSAVDVIVPTSYTFPTTGMLLSLSFIPFAGWFVGANVSFAEYPAFLISGLLSFFAGPYVALPFLLDLLRIPADMFRLFATVDVFSGRFATLLATMHMWVLALLGAAAMAGRLRLRWRQFAIYLGIGALLTLAALGGTRMFFTYAVDQKYAKYTQFVDMNLFHEPVKNRIVEPMTMRDPLLHLGGGRLETIRHRGSSRACYLSDSLPFAFKNAAADLVGFDIDMVHLLARTLGVELEFRRLKREEGVEQHLDSGACDIVASLFVITPDRTSRMTFSVPYLETTVGFIVEDYRRDEFTTWEGLRSQDTLRISLPTQSRYYRSFLERLLPRAEIVPTESPREFFRSNEGQFDAIVTLAEAGSAWTLVYPAYTVVVPLPNPIKLPLVYPLPHGERGLADYVNAWIELKKRDGTLDRLFEYWILGKGAEPTEPRWSVIRNVLHWID